DTGAQVGPLVGIGDELARADRRSEDAHDPAHHRAGDVGLPLDPLETVLARVADPLKLGFHLPAAFGDEADGDAFLGHGSLFLTSGTTLGRRVHRSGPD